MNIEANRQAEESNNRKREIKGKNQKYNKGISCDVKNCVYHDGDTHCTAGKIAVGPSYATSCTDTVCATFKQRNSFS